jgi:hypothetical protein
MEPSPMTDYQSDSAPARPGAPTGVYRGRMPRLLSASGLVDVRVERYRSIWPWGMMTATARTSASLT